jgi:ATP-dependent Clp protease ATP-binding subunit ClpA
MFERFTDRARRVVVLAQEEARILSHNYIGTEHVLLGLLHEGESVAAKALDGLGIQLEPVRQQVEEIVGRGKQAPSGHIPFTARAKRVLELALREALQLGHNYIGPEHILLGLVREGEGIAAQVLVRLGADLNRVRQEVIQRLAQQLASRESDDPERSGDVRRGRSLLRSRAETSAVTDFSVYGALETIGERLAAIEARLGIGSRPSQSRADLEAEVTRLAALLREHGIDPVADAGPVPGAGTEPAAEPDGADGAGAGQ